MGDISGKNKAVLNTLMRIDNMVGMLKSSPVTTEAFSDQDLDQMLKEVKRTEKELEYWTQRFKYHKEQLTKEARKSAGLGEELARIAAALSLVEEDVNPKVGDILVCSWGYDQTNIDFYQVIAVTKASVKIREINKKRSGGTQTEDMMVPIPGDFDPSAKTLTKRVSAHGNSYSVKIESYSSARLWDGKPQGQTAVGYGH